MNPTKDILQKMWMSDISLTKECLSGSSQLLLLRLKIVLYEYSKFQIESNSYFSIRLDSKRAQLFEIFEYLSLPMSYLFNRMAPIFHLSNHA